jgi:predicted glycoside hydrolase/deacetylase ChbG (UPF0249 family)
LLVFGGDEHVKGKRIVINADDFGIHPRTDEGIIRAYTDGILTSATLLATTPWLEQSAQRSRAVGLPTGVHLSLTLGRCRALPALVPDLADETGTLRLNASYILLMRAPNGDVPRFLAQIRAEFEAQLAAVADCGVKPTHCDSHQHVHMHPAVFAIVEDLAKRFGIPHLRITRERLYGFEMSADLLSAVARNNYAKWLLLMWLALRLKPNLTGTDEFFGVKYSGVLTKRALLGIARFSRADVLEIGVHPGLAVPTNETGYQRPGYAAFVSSPWREREFLLLTDKAVAERMRRLGVALCAYDGRVKS